MQSLKRKGYGIIAGLCRKNVIIEIEGVEGMVTNEFRIPFQTCN